MYGWVGGADPVLSRSAGSASASTAAAAAAPLPRASTAPAAQRMDCDPDAVRESGEGLAHGEHCPGAHEAHQTSVGHPPTATARPSKRGIPHGLAGSLGAETRGHTPFSGRRHEKGRYLGIHPKDAVEPHRSAARPRLEVEPALAVGGILDLCNWLNSDNKSKRGGKGCEVGHNVNNLRNMRLCENKGNCVFLAVAEKLRTAPPFSVQLS